MFYRLGQLVTRYRWCIVGFWFIAVVVALPFAPQASNVLQAGGFVSPDVESEQALGLLANKLHLKVNIVQVIFTSQRYTAYDPQFIQEAQQSLASVQSMPEVASIISFVDDPRQISLDRRAADVDIVLNADPNSSPKLLPELQRRLHPVPDLKTSIGGAPVFYQDIQTVSENDLRRAEALAFPFAIIALLLVRSVVAAILPALVGGSAVLVSLALIFGLGHITELSIFVLNITTLFGLGLGVDYSLFMVSRFREELARGRSVEDAVAMTVATAGRAVTFSGFTVSIGLAGLIFFRVNMLHSVGMGGVMVVLIAVFAAITLLPAALAIIGTRINAFPVRIPRLGRRKRIETGDHQHGFWYRLSHLVMRYPVRILVPVLLFLIALGLPFLGVRFSAPDASILPADVPSRAAYDLLASRFAVQETTPMLLAVQTKGAVLAPGNIRDLYNYVRRIEADPRVARVDSIVSADPRFTLEQYELLYEHPELNTDVYLQGMVQATVSGNTLAVLVISKYSALDARSMELAQTIRN